VWFTNVRRFKEMVEKDPNSLEKCILRECRAFEDKLGMDEWLLKRFSSAELGVNVHVALLDEVDEHSVQKALDETAGVISLRQANPFLVFAKSDI
jgi:hypothetical protein